MARYLPDDFVSEQLNIIVEEYFPNCTELFYLPSESDLAIARIDSISINDNKKNLVTFNGQNHYISLSPIITLPAHPNYLESKHAKIKVITLCFDFGDASYSNIEAIDLLEKLPSGFIKDVRYGLGLVKEYHSIIKAIEDISDNTELVIGSDDITKDTSDGYFYLNWKDFNDMRRDCNRITIRARRTASLIKSTAIYNRLAFRLNIQQKPLPTENDAISKMLRINISDTDKSTALDLVTRDRSAIQQAETVKLVKLKADIELVSLERLISKFEELLNKNTKEDAWQKLFNQNPFILTLAFGYPAIKICEQASVGGRRIHGDGEKITDFLVKNGITNNLAIIEIKKPATSLLNKTAYRDNVYSPSSELSGSVNQVLDQRYNLQKNISRIKDDSRLYDIESYAVHCVLVVGLLPGDEGQRKSFEIYRRNSKDVQIMTFDELLLKLKQLCDFLSKDKE